MESSQTSRKLFLRLSHTVMHKTGWPCTSDLHGVQKLWIFTEKLWSRASTSCIKFQSMDFYRETNTS